MLECKGKRRRAMRPDIRDPLHRFGNGRRMPSGHIPHRHVHVPQSFEPFSPAPEIFGVRGFVGEGEQVVDVPPDRKRPMMGWSIRRHGCAVYKRCMVVKA